MKPRWPGLSRPTITNNQPGLPAHLNVTEEHFISMTDSSDAQLRTVLERGMTAHRAGDIESAAQAYEEVLRHAPGHPDALHRIAEILVHASGLPRRLGLRF